MIQSLQYLAGSHTDSSTCLTWKGVPYSAVLVELHLLVTHLGLQVHHLAFSVFYLVTHLGLQSPTYCGVRELICSAKITTHSDFNRLWALCTVEIVWLPLDWARGPRGIVLRLRHKICLL